jgi:hypothetical protein
MPQLPSTLGLTPFSPGMLRPSFERAYAHCFGGARPHLPAVSRSGSSRSTSAPDRLRWRESR